MKKIAGFLALAMFFSAALRPVSSIDATLEVVRTFTTAYESSRLKIVYSSGVLPGNAKHHFHLGLAEIQSLEESPSNRSMVMKIPGFKKLSEIITNHDKASVLFRCAREKSFEVEITYNENQTQLSVYAASQRIPLFVLEALKTCAEPKGFSLRQAAAFVLGAMATTGLAIVAFMKNEKSTPPPNPSAIPTPPAPDKPFDSGSSAPATPPRGSGPVAVHDDSAQLPGESAEEWAQRIALLAEHNEYGLGGVKPTSNPAGPAPRARRADATALPAVRVMPPAMPGENDELKSFEMPLVVGGKRHTFINLQCPRQDGRKCGVFAACNAIAAANYVNRSGDARLMNLQALMNSLPKKEEVEAFRIVLQNTILRLKSADPEDQELYFEETKTALSQMVGGMVVGEYPNFYLASYDPQLFSIVREDYQPMLQAFKAGKTLIVVFLNHNGFDGHWDCRLFIPNSDGTVTVILMDSLSEGRLLLDLDRDALFGPTERFIRELMAA